jgi:hypothetical protein
MDANESHLDVRKKRYQQLSSARGRLDSGQTPGTVIRQ